MSYPLRSELWWPSCALLMRVPILVSWQRVVAYCVLILLANLSAHAIAGDLTTTPVVTIVGLRVGFPVWSWTFSVIGGRFAAYVLRLQWTLARSAHANELVAAAVAEGLAPCGTFARSNGSAHA